MQKPVHLLAAFVVAAAALLGYFAFDSDESRADDQITIASARGVIERADGDLIVDVVVRVPEGVPAEAATNAALAAQGARPADDLQAAAFTTTGLVWDQFSDGNAGNNFVTQHYNPTGEPLDGEAALLNTHSVWSGVATSSFAFEYGGTTNRCPSLVKECSGPQAYDGFNDVTFLSINGPCGPATGCTLGVTWSSSSVDEADMALNTKIAWVHDCNSASNIDAETVFLHENGHVAGLGHSTAAGAIMGTPYTGAQCTLGADDIAGISALYPTGTPAPTSTPTNTPVPTDTPDGPTATPTATNTPNEGGPGCPPGHQRRGICTPTP